MALPVTISGLTIGGTAVCGPFKSSGGNWYIFGRSSSATNNVQAQKATDPTSSFSAVGTDTNFGNGVNKLHLSAVQVGDTIHLFCTNASSQAAGYNSFDMSSDSWGTAAGQGSECDNQLEAISGIVARSDGDLVVGLRGIRESIMGTAYGRTAYLSRQSGTWDTSRTDVGGTGGQVHYTFLGAVLGASDSVHIFYKDSANGLTQRTLNSSYSLQTASTAVTFTGTGSQAVSSGGQGVSYTETQTKVVFLENDNGTIKAFYFDSANTPTINTATVEASSHTGTRVACVLDADDSNAVWAGYVLAADGDYTVEKSTDNGATWSSKATSTTAAIADGVGYLGRTGPAYVQGSNVVMGYTYNDAGTLKYDEYEIRAASADKTLAAAGGSYAVTGTAATLKHAWKTAAASGSYAISGTNATPKLGRKVVAGAESYVISGAAVTLQHTWKLTVDGSSYVISGTDAALNKGKTLAADSGSYAISGAAASPLHDWLLSAAGSSYVISGTDVTLNLGQRVTAEASSYAISGAAAALLLDRKITAVGGTYAVSGTAASLLHNLEIAAAGGSYAISGSEADLLLGLVLAAAGGSYAISGADTSLLHGLRLAADGGVYTISGTAAQALLDRVLTAGSGSYAITGQDATLTLSGGAPVGGAPQGWRFIGVSAGRMGI